MYMYVYIYIYIYIYSIMEYFSTITKSEMLPFAAIWMVLKNIMLSEISRTEKDKSSMISLICVI